MALISLAAVPSVLAFEEAPLIPRSQLMGNAYNANVKVSPDGKMIAFMRPLGTVMNLWVAPVTSPSDAKSITRLTNQRVIDFYWSANSGALLFLSDTNGDENYQLARVTIENGETLDLTHNPAARASVIKISQRHPDYVLAALNDRDPKFNDLYRINIQTAERELVLKGDGFAEIMADDDLKPRLAKTADADGGYTYHAYDGTKWKPILHRSLDNSFSAVMAGYRGSKDDALIIDSGDADKAQLLALDLKTGSVSAIASGVEADIHNLVVDEKTGV
jgi:hypothetical protein